MKYRDRISESVWKLAYEAYGKLFFDHQCPVMRATGAVQMSLLWFPTFVDISTTQVENDVLRVE